jgi:5'-3' exoribonuclease 2
MQPDSSPTSTNSSPSSSNFTPSPSPSPGSSPYHGGTKRPHRDSDSEEETNDEVRLWEDGFKDRYYESKFDVAPDNFKFRNEVASQYVTGLCWVLRYYYQVTNDPELLERRFFSDISVFNIPFGNYFQGCASWKWYFPYHYAPFASDFLNIGDLSTEFEKYTQPVSHIGNF